MPIWLEMANDAFYLIGSAVPVYGVALSHEGKTEDFIFRFLKS
jgi:hypothetical protein